MKIAKQQKNRVRCHTLYGKNKLVPITSLVLRPSVYAVLIQGNRILLVTMSNGKLYFPGGGLNTGETIAEALKREVKEETGLAISIGRLLTWQEDFFYYDPENQAFHGILLFFKCIPRNKILIKESLADREAQNPQWFQISSLKPQQFHGKGGEILNIIRN
jgi:8-oxo-dGTP pyrophosphatase MutT (NUDIX family)